MKTERVERIRQNYLNEKPHISIERAKLWTESFKKSEGQPMEIRSALAFYDTCCRLPVNIFDDELIVGTSGEYRRTGIITPEFGWKWVDEEMENFSTREQDPYQMDPEQIKYCREEIFPYWQGKSAEDIFLARIPDDTRRIGVDTGFIDTDSKWRNGIGEISPDYVDQLLPKGFSGIKKEAVENMKTLDLTVPEDYERMAFYKSMVLVCDGIIALAERYSDKAAEMAAASGDARRRAELEEISEICRRIPAQPPESFREALQFIWFVQLAGIISENPLALNVGRFD